AQSIIAHNVRGDPDVSALASRDKNTLAVLVWHYHDDDVPGPNAAVSLALDHLPWKRGTATVTRYSIDTDHSNSYEAWKRMSSPQQPTPEQYAQLEKAGKLATVGESQTISIENGEATIPIKLPRQAVSLLVLSFAQSK